MFKYFKLILIFIILLTVNKAIALNSSSYLVANAAVKSLDFEKAYDQLSSSKIKLNKNDMVNHLLSAINLNLFQEGQMIAKKILNLD